MKVLRGMLEATSSPALPFSRSSDQYPRPEDETLIEVDEITRFNAETT